MSQNIQLQGNLIETTGRSGDLPLSVSLALAALNITLKEGPVQASLASGANAITLPISPVQFLYLKNLHATQTIIVTWTPQGGASVAIQTLRPGDWIMFSATAGAGSGITALSLNASGAATSCEYILAG